MDFLIHRALPGRWLVAFLLTAVAALAPATALANPTVTVRVEGQYNTWLEPTEVMLGDGTAPARTWDDEEMPVECDDDTAYAAIEKATEGNWDRGYWILEMYEEEHSFSPPFDDYWVVYYNNDYASKVPCEQKMEDGDTLLLQAAPSGPSPDWVPASVPLEIDAPAEVLEGTPFNVHVDAWVPPTTNPGGGGIVPSSVLEDAEDYDIGVEDEPEVLPTVALDTTDSGGDATITLDDAGWQTIVVHNTSDALNWGRVKKRICVKPTLLSTC